MTTSKFTFELGAIGATDGITFETWIDNCCLISTSDFTTRTISCEFDDSSEEKHILKLIMLGKMPEHTTINDDGLILKDSYIKISNMCLDDIALGFEIIDKFVYTHDFNGTRETVKEKFHGILGCNGSVTLEFQTPVYLWILENL